MIKTPPITGMSGAFSVKGKNVVVTGGNRGIGLGIATAFAESGANVVILCRDKVTGYEAVRGFEQYGGEYACIQCDISDNEDVKVAEEQLREIFPSIDVLVNNAGVATTKDFLTNEGYSEWHRVIDTNLHGVANVVHALAPGMRDSGKGGSIINISSVGAQRVSNAKEHSNAPYHSAKAGVDIFTKYLAVTLGDYGIRVNAIAPGPTHSDLDKDLPPSAIEMVESELPTHRFGEAIEIGALCVFLASPAGCQISGVIIPHDGGLMTIT